MIHLCVPYWRASRVRHGRLGPPQTELGLRAAQPRKALFGPVLAAVLAAVLAWHPVAALEPGEARHLLARTHFATTPEAIYAFEQLDRDEAIERIIDQARTPWLGPLPDWTDDFPNWRAARTMDAAERQAFGEERKAEAQELRMWWYRQMVDTPTPFAELLTLFWHNHFTSSVQKVRSAHLMLRQNLLFREHAAGNFEDLLLAMIRDGALLVYLDNHVNTNDAPNENFARELLELFTLGEGEFSEADVQAAAKAFTGYTVNPRSGDFLFRPRQHDYSVKTFLGAEGRFDGEEIARIILDNEQTARFVTEGMWHQFIAQPPEPWQLDWLAGRFRDSGYAFEVLIREILSTEAFWDPSERGAMIKSPTELLVGSIRFFDVPVNEYRRLVGAGQRLGQALFMPPNVKGWDGGEAWITSDSLLSRYDIAEVIARHARIQPPSPPTRDDFYFALVAQPPVSDPDGLLAWVRDPVYQLK